MIDWFIIIQIILNISLVISLIVAFKLINNQSDLLYLLRDRIIKLERQNAPIFCKTTDKDFCYNSSNLGNKSKLVRKDD